MKLTDQETIVHENGLFLKGPKRGHAVRGHTGKQSWLVGGAGENVWARTFTVVSVGRPTGLEWASLSNSGSLWGVRTLFKVFGA